MSRDQSLRVVAGSQRAQHHRHRQHDDRQAQVLRQRDVAFVGAEFAGHRRDRACAACDQRQVRGRRAQVLGQPRQRQPEHDAQGQRDTDREGRAPGEVGQVGARQLGQRLDGHDADDALGGRHGLGGRGELAPGRQRDDRRSEHAGDQPARGQVEVGEQDSQRDDGRRCRRPTGVLLHDDHRSFAVVVNSTNALPSNSFRAVEVMVAPTGASPSKVTASSSTPPGCSMPITEVPELELAEFVGDGAGDRHRGGQVHGARHRVGGMARRRNQVARPNGGVLGLRHQHDLGNHPPADVAHAHQLACLAANPLDAVQQRLVGIDLGGALGSAQSEVGGPNDDGAHARIDAADLDAVDVVDAVARWEQRTGGAAGEVGERQLDGGGTAADPGDRLISAVLDGAIRRLDGGHDAGPGVDEPDTHVGRGTCDGHQAALDRERSDAGEDVAAGGGRVDRAGLRIDLGEEVVDVDVVLGRRSDDGDLAGGGGVAAQAVDLPRGAAHECRQHRVERVAKRGEVVTQEVQTLGCASANLHRWQ